MIGLPIYTWVNLKQDWTLSAAVSIRMAGVESEWMSSICMRGSLGRVRPSQNEEQDVDDDGGLNLFTGIKRPPLSADFRLTGELTAATVSPFSSSTSSSGSNLIRLGAWLTGLAVELKCRFNWAGGVNGDDEPDEDADDDDCWIRCWEFKWWWWWVWLWITGGLLSTFILDKSCPFRIDLVTSFSHSNMIIVFVVTLSFCFSCVVEIGKKKFFIFVLSLYLGETLLHL